MIRVDLPLFQIGARLFANVDLIDIHDKRFIDVVDSPRSVMTGPSGLCDCVTISYAARPVSRQDVNKLRIDDSKLQIDDSTLQIVDSTLQIGDSTLQIGDSKPRIGDLTLLRASSKRRLDVTTRWIVDITDLPPCRKSIIDDSKLQIGDSKLQIGDSKCATVACECDITVTQRHPVDATLKSKHSKLQERGSAGPGAVARSRRPVKSGTSSS
jgi:hypothetical protein